MRTTKILFRDNLRKMKKNKGVTLEDMARDLGFDKGSINNWTTGRYLPTANNIDILCSYFNVNPVDFFVENYD